MRHFATQFTSTIKPATKRATARPRSRRDLRETDGKTRVVVRDLYPSNEALEDGSGSTYAMPESLAQLDDLLATLQATD